MYFLYVYNGVNAIRGGHVVVESRLLFRRAGPPHRPAVCTRTLKRTHILILSANPVFLTLHVCLDQVPLVAPVPVHGHLPSQLRQRARRVRRPAGR